MNDNLPQEGAGRTLQSWEPYKWHPYPDYPHSRLRLALSAAVLRPVRVGTRHEAECPICEERTLDLIRLPDGRPALRPRCRCDIDDIWGAVIDAAAYNWVDAEQGLANWDFELLPRQSPRALRWVVTARVMRPLRRTFKKRAAAVAYAKTLRRDADVRDLKVERELDGRTVQARRGPVDATTRTALGSRP